MLGTKMIWIRSFVKKAIDVGLPQIPFFLNPFLLLQKYCSNTSEASGYSLEDR